MISSVPFAAGDGLDVRNFVPSAIGRMGVDDGGLGRNDCTKKLKA